MGQCWHRSTGNLRTQIGTCTFHPTTPWPTRLQLSEHYTPEWNPSTPQCLTRMKRWNTSGKPSLLMVTLILKLWYTTTQCSPAPGQWIEMTHRAQWSFCPMCRGCQRRCITSLPHWVSRSPSVPIQHSDTFWWDQRIVPPREYWLVLSTKFPVLDALPYTWGRLADVSTSGWVSTSGRWSQKRQPPLHWQSTPGGHTTRWIGIRSGCWTTNPIATRDQSWSPSTSDHRLGH